MNTCRCFLSAHFPLPIAALAGWLLAAAPARADVTSIQYTELPASTSINLTNEGTLDWIKFGNGEDNTTTFLNTTKIGNPVFDAASLTPLGTPPAGHTVNLVAFSSEQNLNFFWSNGNFGMFNGTGPVDTVVTETILPGVSSYPIGLGAQFEANAAATLREMDVYVQGFNADMLITASMSGGSSQSVVVTPSQVGVTDPNNDYSFGRFRIRYQGVGETLTVSVVTQNPRTSGAQQAFANAGFFAAAVRAVPEPASAGLIGFGLLGILACGRRRRS